MDKLINEIQSTSFLIQGLAENGTASYIGMILAEYFFII